MSIKGPGKEMQRRMAVTGIVARSIGFSAVALRFGSGCKFIGFEYYNTRASSLQTRDTILQPKRGTIYDSRTTELAVSASTKRVEIYPVSSLSKDNVKLFGKGLNIPASKQQERVARLLSTVFGIEYETVQKSTR